MPRLGIHELGGLLAAVVSDFAGRVRASRRPLRIPLYIVLYGLFRQGVELVIEEIVLSGEGTRVAASGSGTVDGECPPNTSGRGG